MSHKKDRTNFQYVFQSDRIVPALYLDEHFLDKCYLPIGTGQAETKTRQVGTDWSVAGPIVKFQQIHGFLTATSMDKIRDLLEHLWNNHQLKLDRFRGDERDPEEKDADFRLERFVGRRVVIKNSEGKPVLSLWFSRQEPAGWMTLLLLLEAAPGSVAGSEFYSTYSQLSLFLIQLVPQLAKIQPFSMSHMTADKKRTGCN